jgi:HEPN domain-containing protein
MKAALIGAGQLLPKTHDLTVLSALLSSFRPEWHWPVEELRLLSRSAVIFRYPGESADREEVEAALAASKAVRNRLLSLLQEPS